MAASKPDETDADAPVFRATITPHRSLTPKGRRIVMTLVCLATFISTLPFYLMGAWPIVGFGGLDILALYIALRVNTRDGQAVEEVVLSRVELLLRRATRKGRREWRLNPLWTRLERTDDPEFGVTALAFVSRGTRVSVGAWLSPPERATLGHALGEALAKAKRG